MDLVAGQQVDRYRVDGRLGEGGMAVVYSVHHTRLDTRHALKVLTITHSRIRERLLDEGRIQASVRHPNIVAVSDVLDVQGAPALLMEFVDGPSLDDLIRSSGALPIDTADALARGILAGVAAAHARGLVHRDLKPANILLAHGPEGLVPKVSDFGLARLMEDGAGRTKTGSTMGTPQYMAPEQVRDAKSVGPESDVFALGAIFYEMLTGRRAFEGEDLVSIFQSSMSGTWTPLDRLREDVPPRMARAIAGALAADRTRRTQSVEALLSTWVGDATAPPVADSGIVRRVEELASARTTAAPTSADLLSRGPDPSMVPSRSAPSSPSGAVWLGLGGLLAAWAVGATLILAALAAAWWWSSRPSAPLVDVQAAPAPVAEAPVPQPPPPAPEAVPQLVPVPLPAPSMSARTPPPEAPAEAPAPPEDIAVVEVPPPEPTPEAPAVVEPPPPPLPASDPRAGLPPALRSQSEAVRMSHLLLLAADPSSAPILSTVARTDPSDSVRARALRTALEHWRRGFGPAAVQEDLAGWAARSSTSKRLRSEALVAIGRRGTRLDDAVAALADGDPGVRTTAVGAVRDIGLRGQAAGARAALEAAAVHEADTGVSQAIRAAIAAL